MSRFSGDFLGVGNDRRPPCTRLRTPRAAASAVRYDPGMRTTAAILVAVLTFLCPEAPAWASVATTAKGGSFTMSGQEDGTLTLNAAETCLPDNFSGSPLSEDIRLYLNDHGLKPTSALWFMLIEAKAPGTVRYPADSPNIVSLGADSGAEARHPVEHPLWRAGPWLRNVDPKGRLRVREYRPCAGSQYRGEARLEKIVGYWSCK